MARVTVEDCIIHISNRFELVLLAACRARDLSAGASITIARDNDRNPVVALREIAEQTLPLDELRANCIRKGLPFNLNAPLEHEEGIEEDFLNLEDQKPILKNERDNDPQEEEELEEEL